MSKKNIHILFVMLLVVGSAPAIAAPSKSGKQSAAKTEDVELRAESDEELGLKKEDLLEEDDATWFPNLNALPSDYMEDLEIPKRSQKETDEIKI